MSEATEEEHTTHRSYAIKARFADNAQGTLTFREYVDQCSRNAESAGGETMVKIMKGDFGEFDMARSAHTCAKISARTRNAIPQRARSAHTCAMISARTREEIPQPMRSVHRRTRSSKNTLKTQR